MPNKLVSGKFTAQQRAFVKAYADTGDAELAATRAGYHGNAAVLAWDLLHNPQIVAGIHAEISLRIRTKGAQIAQSVLMAAAQAADAPWSTRVDAAKALLDRAGLAAVRQREPERAADRPLAEYSIDELRATVDRLEREAADQATPVKARQLRADLAQEAPQDIDLIA